MRKFIKISLLIIGILAIAVIIGNYMLGNFIEKKLIENDSDYSIKVRNVDVSLLRRSVSFDSIKIFSKGSDFGTIKKVTVSNISPMLLFNKKNITIGKVAINKGDFNLNKKKLKDSTKQKKQLQFTIDEIEIDSTNITYKSATDKKPITTSNINVKLKNLTVDTSAEEKPFNYDDLKIAFDKLTLPINSYQDFEINKAVVDEKNINTGTVAIKTLYTKEELQKQVSVQTDWIDLVVDSLVVNNYKRNTNENSYAAENIKIINADLKVYKDKLLPEPTKYKPLYSKALRELPFDLIVDSITIKKSRIEYQERVKNYDEPGSIVFTNVNSKIKNVNTIEGNGSTFIDITSKFMGDADFHLQWKFDINNTADYFTLHGNMKHLNAEKINDFIEPNMNVTTKGAITSIVFDIGANENVATGTFNLKYDDFKVTILRKNEKIVNKFFTGIANLFVGNSKKENTKVPIEVKRNKQKSFFNYFWLCVKEGTIQSILK